MCVRACSGMCVCVGVPNAFINRESRGVPRDGQTPTAGFPHYALNSLHESALSGVGNFASNGDGTERPHTGGEKLISRDLCISYLLSKRDRVNKGLARPRSQRF